MAKEINKVVLSTFLNNLPGSMRTQSQDTKIGVGTISGWKNKKHTPREDSLDIFIKEISKKLSLEQKVKISNTIMEAVNIDIRGRIADSFRREAEENFEEFINYMLKEYGVRKNYDFNFLDYEVEKINEIIFLKMNQWIEETNGISIGKKTYNNATYFNIRLRVKNEKMLKILICYSLEYYSLDCVKKSINEYKIKNLEDNICCVYIVFFRVEDMDYLKILKEYGIYLKQILEEEIKEKKVNNYFVNLSGVEDSITLQKINMFADVIYKKMLECLYLIYKEVLCNKYNINNVNKYFFQTNLGIGLYPYAIRRAISFEKKLIEREFTERKKVDLIIDINCIGGLYGLRLHKYAKKILCVDSSQKTIDTIDKIVLEYNKNVCNQKELIANVQTELFREETCEILCNSNFHQKADYIILGLGTLSYVKEYNTFLRKIGNLLKEDGRILLSCYNSESLSIIMNKYENLNYEYDIYNKRFIYNKTEINIPVPARLFTLKDFRNLILKYFDIGIEHMWSYPVISSIFLVDEKNKGAEIIKEVDKTSASFNHYQLAYGNYNIIEAVQYQDKYKANMYVETKKVIFDLKIECKEIKHDIFISQDTLVNVLNERNIYIKNNFIKSILIKDISNGDDIKYFFLILPLKEKVQKIDLKNYYRERGYVFNKKKIKFCSEKELRKFGFSVGSISIFSYSVLKNKYNIDVLFHRAINEIECTNIYTYSGNCASTYKIKLKDLQKYLEIEEAKLYSV